MSEDAKSTEDMIDNSGKTSNEGIPITDDPIPEAVTGGAKLQADDAPDPEGNYAGSIRAWRTYCDQYRQTKSKRHRIVMQQVANCAFYGEMDIAYVLTVGLAEALRAERAAQRGLYPDALYSIVADGIARGLQWRKINIKAGGSHYRRSAEAEASRDRYDGWTATEMVGATIEIGKHSLEVGLTVPQILKALEERYDIDFKELEKKWKQKQPRHSAA